MSSPRKPALSDGDLEAVRSFRNFLSWRVSPTQPTRPWPPAVWAYAWGLTPHCPLIGTL